MNIYEINTNESIRSRIAYGEFAARDLLATYVRLRIMETEENRELSYDELQLVSIIEGGIFTLTPDGGMNFTPKGSRHEDNINLIIHRNRSIIKSRIDITFDPCDLLNDNGHQAMADLKEIIGEIKLKQFLQNIFQANQIELENAEDMEYLIWE